jgi:hypothetical protein
VRGTAERSRQLSSSSLKVTVRLTPAEGGLVAHSMTAPAACETIAAQRERRARRGKEVF